jgi:hypothetical protein
LKIKRGVLLTWIEYYGTMRVSDKITRNNIILKVPCKIETIEVPNGTIGVPNGTVAVPNGTIEV